MTVLIVICIVLALADLATDRAGIHVLALLAFAGLGAVLH